MNEATQRRKGFPSVQIVPNITEWHLFRADDRPALLQQAADQQVFGHLMFE